MIEVERIVGVYDADGGLRGEIAYLAGKLSGHHCSLCDITHSPVRRRRTWDEYVASLPVPFEVVHRNERSPAVQTATEGREPCVVVETTDGRVLMLLDSGSLKDAGDVSGLARRVEETMAQQSMAWPAPGRKG